MTIFGIRKAGIKNSQIDLCLITTGDSLESDQTSSSLFVTNLAFALNSKLGILIKNSYAHMPAVGSH